MSDAFQPDPPKSTSPFKVGVVVGLGCIVALAAIVAIVGGGAIKVFRSVKEAGPLPVGLEMARSNARVVEALGEPIDSDFGMSGEIRFSDDGGVADAEFSISGPKGEGRLRLVGTKRGEEWTFTRAEVTVEETGETIDLLGERV